MKSIRGRSLQVAGRSVPLWTVASAFVLASALAYAPYLSSGFAADDFIFINMMEGATPFNPLLGFWSVPVDQCQGFTQLWWVGASSAGAFLRPVPSWTLTALYGVFGRNALPFHLTSAVIHGLVAFTAFLLLRRLSGRDVPALLAALLFLVCEDHAMTVAWVATITDLLCALFLNLALLCHVTGRQNRNSWLFASSLMFFLFAFASKETAAVYPMIVGFYELFFAERLAGREGGVSLATRVKLVLGSWWAWTLPLVVFIAYMTFYRSLLPPLTTMMYVDPFSQPGRYLAAAVPNIPVLFLALLSPFLPSITLMMPGTLFWAAGLGLVLVVLLTWSLLPYRGEPTIWFSLVVFTLALLPGLATDPGERLLYYPSVFGFFPIAWLILHIPTLKRRLMPESPAGIRVLGSFWGWYLLISALILPVLLLFVFPSMWIPSMALPERTVVDCLPLIDSSAHEHVVYLNTNSSFNTFYLPDIYRYHRGEYVDLRVLSSFNGHLEARSRSPKTIALRTADSGWLSNLFARIPRVDSDLAAGDTYVNGTFTATILQVTPRKHDVFEVEFDFHLPLESPSLVLLYWDGKAYQRWKPTDEWQLLNSTVSSFSF
jgi:hypothetical protein